MLYDRIFSENERRSVQDSGETSQEETVALKKGQEAELNTLRFSLGVWSHQAGCLEEDQRGAIGNETVHTPFKNIHIFSGGELIHFI